MNIFFFSNFRLVLNVVFLLLGDSPASEFYVQTFRNILYHLHVECSETSAYKIQTPGNYPKKEKKNTTGLHIFPGTEAYARRLRQINSGQLSSACLPFHY